MDTISFRGQSYHLGTPGTPLSLSMLLPEQISGWKEIDARRWCPERDYGRGYVQMSGGLQVVISATIEERKRWLHVSISHQGGRLPSWREMCEVKAAFCGAERTAYQIHPPADKHVSIHNKCLHLFCCLDGPVTPDFTGGGETI